MKKDITTGQEIFETPVAREIKEEVKCPVCEKLIDLRWNAWFDPYSEGGPKYVCRSHLSAKRQHEIKIKNYKDNVVPEKDDIRTLCENYHASSMCFNCHELFATRESDCTHPNRECFKAKKGLTT